MKGILNPINIYYISNWLYKKNIPLLPSLLQILIFILFKAVIPFKATIGQKCKITHGGIGVVIHPNAIIGDRVLINHQVTIGGSGLSTEVPVIGSDTYIGAGAKIIGPVTIGSNCAIGANAVVTKSFPPKCVIAGVPAKIIKSNVQNIRMIENW
jgi:serine O-acetyltransferase